MENNTKVYISADIEGVTGITHWDEATRTEPEYQEYREQMTREVVAACDGAFAAGASEVIVKDAHWTARNLITAERTALNFLQRMSGIATLTARFVEAVAGTKAIILDTRKTAPGLRWIDKWAVRLGGGQNHRYGLYDMVLIKDNHIAAAGGITPRNCVANAG